LTRIVTAEDIDWEDTEQLPLYCPLCLERLSKQIRA